MTEISAAHRMRIKSVIELLLKYITAQGRDEETG